jgi:hypothetical protein
MGDKRLRFIELNGHLVNLAHVVAAGVDPLGARVLYLDNGVSMPISESQQERLAESLRNVHGVVQLGGSNGR